MKTKTITHRGKSYRIELHPEGPSSAVQVFQPQDRADDPTYMGEFRFGMLDCESIMPDGLFERLENACAFLSGDPNADED